MKEKPFCLLLCAALASCGGGGSETQSAVLPPAPINGVGVYTARVEVNDADGTHIPATNPLMLAGELRAMIGWCPRSGYGRILDYRYTRTDDTTGGTVEVRRCPGGALVSGTGSGTVVNHASNDFTISGPSVSGFVSESTYSEPLTEAPADFAGSYVSDAGSSGAKMNGLVEISVTITSGGEVSIANGDCPGTGTISLTEGKSVASVSIPNCRNGETVTGLAHLNDDQLFIFLTVPNAPDFYWGTLTRP